MSFLGKTNFCANQNVQHCQMFHVIESDMLNVILLLHYLVPLTFPFSSASTAKIELQQSPVPLHFPLSIVVITMDRTPSHLACYFQGPRLPFNFSRIWSGSQVP